MLEEIFTKTLFSPEVLPFTKVLARDSSRKSKIEPPSPLMLRLLLAPTEDSPSGEEVPLSLLSQPSPACGSPRRTTKSTVLPSFTESAFEEVSQKLSRISTSIEYKMFSCNFSLACFYLKLYSKNSAVLSTCTGYFIDCKRKLLETARMGNKFK